MLLVLLLYVYNRINWQDEVDKAEDQSLMHTESQDGEEEEGADNPGTLELPPVQSFRPLA